MGFFLSLISPLGMRSATNTKLTACGFYSRDDAYLLLLNPPPPGFPAVSPKSNVSSLPVPKACQICHLHPQPGLWGHGMSLSPGSATKADQDICPKIKARLSRAHYSHTGPFLLALALLGLGVCGTWTLQRAKWVRRNFPSSLCMDQSSKYLLGLLHLPSPLNKISVLEITSVLFVVSAPAQQSSTAGLLVPIIFLWNFLCRIFK